MQNFRTAWVIFRTLPLLAAFALPAAAQTPAPPAAEKPATAVAQPLIEPKAIELLKAMSDRLAAAHTMTFTAVTTYESPAIATGQPLAYSTISKVAVQRPDKLRVIVPGDGPPSEFYYNGKTMIAYAPNEGMVAVADAPPTIDAMLQQADRIAAIYFPFTDVIVADPYKDIAGDIRMAFVVGQSRVVGGTLTDIIVVVTDNIQGQIWIGAEDHLPRRMRATFFGEPGQFRHDLEFRDWKLDPVLPAGTFGSDKVATAKHIKFVRPDAPVVTPSTKKKGEAQP